MGKKLMPSSDVEEEVQEEGVGGEGKTYAR